MISLPSRARSRPSFRACTHASRATRLATAPGAFPQGCPKVPPPNWSTILNKVREKTHHAPLEGSWCIAQAKMHSLISIRSERTCKSGLFLILRGYINLEITCVTI
ncbi:hypothetical protein AHAS_Ahas06G0182400 [Arachis hypogaea]